MSWYLITFGGAAFDATVAKTVDACAQQDIACHVYDDRWLTKQNFYAENHWIFTRQPQHGFGFCSWKPYIIQHALLSVAEGDVIMYLDGDTYPVAPLAPLFELAERDGIVLFEEQGCVNKTWIKRDCFDAMGALEFDERERMIACGRFQLYRKGWAKLDVFLQEWKVYSLDPRCQFHEGSEAGGDDPSFIKNSCEQSVLSILAAQYGIPLHRTPDQNGWPATVHPEDEYPLLLIQVGSRGNLRDWSGSKFANIR